MRSKNWNTWRRRALLSLTASWLAMVLATGCGRPERWPQGGMLQGEVAIGGEPVTSGRVCVSCAKEGVSDAVAIDAKGRFRFVNRLPIGDYVVWFDGGPPPLDGVAPTPWPDASRFPGKYQDEATTPLKLTLQKGANNFPISLESGK